MQPAIAFLMRLKVADVEALDAFAFNHDALKGRILFDKDFAEFVDQPLAVIGLLCSREKIHHHRGSAPFASPNEKPRADQCSGTARDEHQVDRFLFGVIGRDLQKPAALGEGCVERRKGILLGRSQFSETRGSS